MPFTPEFMVVVLGKVLRPAWDTYAKHREALVPLGALAAGAVAAWVGLGQLNTARRRHEEQTKADLQRRITESFIKAVEQLGNDKQLTIRLGGIYTLQRISKESPDDYYWPIMETLTGFVRDHARWKEGEKEGEGEATPHLDREPPTDVVAILEMIKLRSDENRRREVREDLCYNLSGADLRGADLSRTHLEDANLFEAHFEGAVLSDAHFEDAILQGAHLEGAKLWKAHLERANLREAHLEKADLTRAHLEGAELWEAHLEGADLRGAHLEGAELRGAHLEGADLRHAEGLTQTQLDRALGDAATGLPEGLTRPAHWPLARENG